MLVLAAILVAAAFLRIVGDRWSASALQRPPTVLEEWLSWDHGQNLHPDERFLVLVASAIEPPSSVAEYLDTRTSPANPHNAGYTFYPYGSWPPLAIRALGELLGRADFDGLTIVGRAASAVSDLATLLLLFLIGRRVVDDSTALVGVALAACCVLSIQQARFGTVDSVGTMLITFTVLWCVVIARRSPWWAWPLAGLGVGAATATKISLWAVAGMVPLAAAVQLLRATNVEGGDHGRVRRIAIAVAGCAVAAVAALVAFRLLMPYAFAGTHLFDPSPNPRWFGNLREVSRQMNGSADFPPAIQWADRTPYLHPLRNLFFWGLGPPLALAALTGWTASIATLLGARGRTALVATTYVVILLTAGWFGLLGGATSTLAALIAAWVWVAGMTLEANRERLLLVLPIAWVSTYFAYQGVQFVKPMRYLLPICPFLCLLAAITVVGLIRRVHRLPDGSLPPRAGARRVITACLAATVIIATVAWAWGFSAIYRRTHTRIEASRWIFGHLTAAVTAVLVDGDDRWMVPVEIAAPFELDRHGGARVGRLRSHRDGALDSILLRVARPSSEATVQASVVAAEGPLSRGRGSIPSDDGGPGSMQLVTVPLEPIRVEGGQSYQVGVSLTDGQPVHLGTGVVAVEEWDDELPLPIDGRASFQIYQRLTMPTYAVDGRDKLDRLVDILDRSDLIVLSSHRGVASVVRMPRRYPLQNRFFELLADGRLGYDLVGQWTSWPRLLFWWLPDQEVVGRWAPRPTPSLHSPPAEEPFSVYDHPRVFVFQRSMRFDAESARVLLSRDLRPSRGLSPRQATAAAWERRLRPIPGVGPWLARRIQDRARRLDGTR